MSQEEKKTNRSTVFISKATPEDDEFVLWLAPRLEAAGYTVFADILSLDPGGRWRKKVTGALQNESIKMLLCCRDTTLNKNGVQEEIGIAEDLAKELRDPQFIIPLRLEKFKKVFGIGELQYVDFVGSWARGLQELLAGLEKQGVSRSTDKIVINPNWENYKKRLSIKVQEAPEVLTTNWLRVTDIPMIIRYYQPSGAIVHAQFQMSCRESSFPSEIYNRGFFSFASPEEVEEQFANVGKFVVHSEHEFASFLESGSKSSDIRPRQAQNLLSVIFRKSWENFCRSTGFYEYDYSGLLGFHVTKDQAALGKRISWGKQGARRSSMLRNIIKGKVWQYGVSATPHFWPYMHLRLKARVLFSPLVDKEAGDVFDDSEEQHRLRRSLCKGWRNKAWHGRQMAFLGLLSGDSPYFELTLSKDNALKVDATPVLVTSPITTILPDILQDDSEEYDVSTLGGFFVEEVE